MKKIFLALAIFLASPTAFAAFDCWRVLGLGGVRDYFMGRTPQQLAVKEGKGKNELAKAKGVVEGYFRAAPSHQMAQKIHPNDKVRAAMDIVERAILRMQTAQPDTEVTFNSLTAFLSPLGDDTGAATALEALGTIKSATSHVYDTAVHADTSRNLAFRQGRAISPASRSAVEGMETIINHAVSTGNKFEILRIADQIEFPLSIYGFEAQTPAGRRVVRGAAESIGVREEGQLLDNFYLTNIPEVLQRRLGRALLSVVPLNRKRSQFEPAANLEAARALYDLKEKWPVFSGSIRTHLIKDLSMSTFDADLLLNTYFGRLTEAARPSERTTTP